MVVPTVEPSPSTHRPRWAVAVVGAVVGSLLTTVVFWWHPWQASSSPVPFDDVAFSVAVEQHSGAELKAAASRLGARAESVNPSLGDELVGRISWEIPPAPNVVGTTFEFYLIDKNTNTLVRQAEAQSPDARTGQGFNSGEFVDAVKARAPWLSALRFQQTSAGWTAPGTAFFAMVERPADTVSFTGFFMPTPSAAAGSENPQMRTAPIDVTKDLLVAVVWSRDGVPLGVRRLMG